VPTYRKNRKLAQKTKKTGKIRKNSSKTQKYLKETIDVEHRRLMGY